MSLVNIRARKDSKIGEGEVYVGRQTKDLPGSVWANPFSIKQYSEEVCMKKFLWYFWSNELLYNNVVKCLKGKKLVTWFTKEAKNCHATYMSRLANDPGFFSRQKKGFLTLLKTPVADQDKEKPKERPMPPSYTARASVKPLPLQKRAVLTAAAKKAAAASVPETIIIPDDDDCSQKEYSTPSSATKSAVAAAAAVSETIIIPDDCSQKEYPTPSSTSPSIKARVKYVPEVIDISDDEEGEIIPVQQKKRKQPQKPPKVKGQLYIQDIQDSETDEEENSESLLFHVKKPKLD